jgi:two-component system, cell cycle response regulator DivK
VKDIVIVEDNPVNRELIREILESRGFSVREAADGERALTLLREIMPEIALIDIQMPKVSGLELVKMIREDPQLRSIRCIALTAYAMSGDQERALQAGFDAYVTKPFESRQLLQTIKDLSDQ